MKIQLDSTALAALVAADPAFTLELQRAVVAEVGRKTFLRDLGDILPLVNSALVKELVQAAKTDGEMSKAFEAALNGAITKYEQNGWNQRAALKDDQKKLITEAVDRAVAEQREQSVSRAKAALEETVNAYIKRFEDELPGVLERRIDRHVQARIDAGVVERLNALKNAL